MHQDQVDTAAMQQQTKTEWSDRSRPEKAEEGHAREHTVTRTCSREPEQTATATKPTGLKLICLTTAICLTIFLISVDFSILATAIPAITAEFKSVADIGWYGSSYLLTTASSQLLLGKCYTVFDLKWTFLLALLAFEVGSIICATAPSSVVLIIGRAIAGCGNAGLLSGALLILTHSVPLEKRPLFMAMTGGTYGVAAIAGPPLGGVFTDKLSWRWCFWINLPIGALTFLVIVFLFKSPPRSGFDGSRSWLAKVMRFDPVGTLMFMPAIICVLLALQWGGTTYAWNSGIVVALLVVGGVLVVAFGIVQWLMHDDATIPLRIMKKRTIWACAAYQFALGAAFFVFIYFLPIWFQGVQGASAIQSGVRTLPMLVGNIVATAVSGVLVTIIGYYAPFMILGTILASVGAGLLLLFTPNATAASWIGYQAVVGLGIGFGWQQPFVAVQTVLDIKDVPIATATLSFAQTLGGTLFVSVAQTAFSTKLTQELVSQVPQLDPASILHEGGAAELDKLVPEQYLPDVVLSYNNSLLSAFFVATIMAIMSLVGCTFVEWNSVKGKKVDAVPAA